MELTNLWAIDEAKYKAYSPPYLPATFAFVYGLSFASLTSVLTHVYYFHWDELRDGLTGTLQMDIHARLMAAYKRVPWYWSFGIICVVLAMCISMTEVYHTNLPVWGIFIAFLIPAVYMIPCGMIQGITNVDANQVNVVAELIGG